MTTEITASMLYSYILCPHRITADLTFDPALRLEESSFIQLLWEQGNAFEADTIAGLEIEFLNLSHLSTEEKLIATVAAMDAKTPLIYGGRIATGGLVGEPDLLRLETTGYAPIDIKSGSGEEGESEFEDGKPKKQYAVQLGLYLDILRQLGRTSGLIAYVWDINGNEVSYDFTKARGLRTPSTLWDLYHECLGAVRRIANRIDTTRAALGSSCKLCPWRKVCKEQLVELDDLSLIFELGRSKRDALLPKIATVAELSQVQVDAYVKGKKTEFPGIGPDTLLKFKNRAKLLKTPKPKPYLKEVLKLPIQKIELFYDVETDPMRDICYLHGIVERRDNNPATQKYISFLAEEPTEKAEEQVFAAVWNYFKSFQERIIYYYSPYERTTWRNLQKKYPHVVTIEQVEMLFDAAQAIDLYHGAVRPSTEWPTSDYSIKTLASWLDFSWRDTHPSGAASIEWYHQWVKTGDLGIKKRILDYNEDDCVATAVLLDGLRKLTVLDSSLKSA